MLRCGGGRKECAVEEGRSGRQDIPEKEQGKSIRLQFRQTLCLPKPCRASVAG